MVDRNGVTTSFSFRASTTLHLGALKVPINIDKSVTVPALNQLKGFGLNSLQILVPAAPSEYQFLTKPAAFFETSFESGCIRVFC